MKVIVVPPDPAWPDAFDAASRELAGALGENLFIIHHIGSTAIPGIWAKPVIDLLPVVRDIARVDEHVAAMQALGYESKGEFGIPGRRYFRRRAEASMPGRPRSRADWRPVRVGR